MTLNRKYRAALIFAACLVLLALSSLYCLQTNWFKQKVREHIVAAIQQVTGGRVEIGSFSFDWRFLTADFRKLVIHGTESKSDPPLFRADSVAVGLRIISLLKRQVDVSYVKVRGPHVYLLIHPDGTTNIPAPQVRTREREVVHELLSLKVRHFELNQGTIEAQARRISLNALGEDFKLGIAYDFTGPRYVFSASARQLHIDSDQFQRASADLDAQGAIEANRFILRKIALRSGGSTVEGSGVLLHFAHPSADLQLSARLTAAQLAGIMKVPELRGGEIGIRAIAHYDESTRVLFNGKVDGRDLVYRSRSLTFAGGEFESDAAGSSEELRLTNLSASALGSRLQGEAVIRGLREFQFNGRVTGLSLREIGRFYTNQAVPWSGIARGPVHVQGTLDRNRHDFVLHGDLQITPATGGIPVSGDLSASYRGGVLGLGHSRLDFPSTHLSISGIPGGTLQVTLDSTNLNDIQPIFSLAYARPTASALPFRVDGGNLHFEGLIGGRLRDPHISGNVAVSRFRMYGQVWDQFQSGISISASELDFTSLEIDRGVLHASGDARIGLADWSIRDDSPLRVHGNFRGVDVATVIPELWKTPVPASRGIASGSLDITGSLNAPEGNAQLTIDNLIAYGEQLNQLQITTRLAGDQLQITEGRVRAGPALISFGGTYQHARDSWRNGRARLKIDSNGFQLANLSFLHRYEPGLNGLLEIHAQTAARIIAGVIEPTSADGRIMFRNIAIDDVRYGDVTFTGTTRGRTLHTAFSGDLREARLNGAAEVQLVSGTPVKGELHVNRMDLGALHALINSGQATPLPVRGFLQGGLTFEGSLQEPEKMHSTIRVEQIQLNPQIAVQASGQLKPSDLTFRNQNPVVLETSDGLVTVRSLKIIGKDTSLGLSGSIACFGERAMDLRAEGSVDLRALSLFDTNVQSSGKSQISASIRGTLKAPVLTGYLDIQNGAFSLNNVAGGLTDVNGTIKFERDRASIEKLTAHSGGGNLSLGGFMGFASGSLVYRIEASADNVRLRYAGGISVTANSELRLTGTSKSSRLSGAIRVSQITFNPNTDMGGLLARGRVPVPASDSESDFLTGLQLDIRVESAPELQLNTSLSEDVEGEIDLRVRGTPGRPIVLGTVSANQGEIKVFGTKYSINRGLVSFTNPIKIEPVLDVDLQTQTRGITVGISLSGTLNELNINYRSDPPLQPRDIVALLALGRAPDPASAFASTGPANDVSSLQAGANTVLGQAISPSSNRLSKLFGITNLKLDPLVQSITTTPQARLTVEQQMSNDITITYITNLSQTSEQIFRLEWALNRQYSVIAQRDDNGEFGIDIQYKKRF